MNSGRSPSAGLSRLLLCAAAFLASHVPLRAASYQWDTNGATAGLGGTGTWTSSAAYWDDLAAGVNAGADTTSALALSQSANFFRFGGTAGTVNLAGSTSVGGITFNTDSYIIDTKPSTISYALNIGSSGITANNNASIVTSNSAGGCITLGAAQSWTVASGKTLTVSAAVTNPNYGLIITGSGDTSITGNIGAGSASLTKSGAGTLTLSGTNTFSGGVNLSAGTLNINSAQALGSGTFTIGAGTTIDNTRGSNVTLSGNVNQVWSGEFTFKGSDYLNMGTGTVHLVGNVTIKSEYALWGFESGGIISGTGSLSIGKPYYIDPSSSADVTLTGVNTYSGGTNVVMGSLKFSSGSLGTVGQISVGNPDNTAELIWASGNTQDISARLTFVDNQHAWFNTNGNNVTFASSFGNAKYAGFNKEGAGTLTLLGSNTYTGGTLVSAGTLVLGHATDTLDDASYLWLFSGSTLDIGSNSDTVSEVKLWYEGCSIVGTGTLTSSFFVVATTSGTSTISAHLAGPGSLTKSEAGTLLITSSASYTGGTIVTGGTLTLGHATNTLANTGAVTVSGGILDIGANTDTVGVVTLSSGSITGTTGTLTGSSYSITNTSGTTAISAKLGGSAALAKTGAGALTLSGANTYTGGTTVSAGTLTLAHATNTLADTGAVTVSGGILDIGANTDTVGVVTLSSGSITGTTGTLTGSSYTVSNTSGTTTISANLGGSAALTKSGAGALTLSGANTYTGGTTVSAGTLTIADGTNALADTGAVTVSGGILAIGEDSETVGALTISSGSVYGFAGTLTASSYGVNNSSGTVRITAIWGGGGVLTKSGAGTLDLLSANTFWGGTTITGGVLSFANGSLGSSGNITVNGGTLQWATGNTQDVSARLALANGGSATLDTVANNVTLANAFGGSKMSSLKKIGAGTLTLSGANTYAGVTTIDAGKLVVSSLGDGVSASSLGTAGLAPANLVLATGVTLGYAGAGETSGRGFTMASSATIDASGAGALAFSSAAKVAFSNSTSARTLTLTGTNTGANIFGAGLLVGATLDEDKVSQVVKDGVGTWIIANGEALKSSAQVDITAGILGVVSQVLRAGNVVTLRNTSTLRWEPGDTDDLSPYIHLASGAAATLDVGANNITFAQSLAFDGGSAASLTKTGAGTLTLVASNSGITGGFILNQGGVNVLSATGLGSGPTIVNGGVLSVNAATTNSVTVNNSGTIGGSGTIARLDVNSGGHVSPGNSYATLTVSTVTTLAGGAVIEWQVRDALDSTKFDCINFGTLNLSGASHANPIIFKVISLDGTSGNPLNFSSDDILSFNLGTIAALNLGTNANINDVFRFDLSQFTYTEGTLSSAGLWSMSYDSVSGALTLTAVPEPSTYGLSLGALALMGAVIRRRNKTKKCR